MKPVRSIDKILSRQIYTHQGASPRLSRLTTSISMLSSSTHNGNSRLIHADKFIASSSTSATA